MTTDPDIAYHLKELEIACNPASAHHAMPDFLDTDQAILDIGCGIGQTFVASTKIHGKERLLVGLDINLKCLKYGHRHFSHVTYVNGTAERLPFQTGLFDLLISRVSLPYTNIQLSLSDANRVLKADGRVWFTLHPFLMTLGHLWRAIRRLDVKNTIFQSYVIFNGLFFHFFGKQFPFIVSGRYESFQTTSGMYKAMRRAGFGEIRIGKRGEQLVCTGRKLA